MAEKKLIAVFELQTAASVQNLEEIVSAEQAVNAAGTTMATSLSNAFEQIQNRSLAAFEKINGGQSVSQAQLDQLAGKYVTASETITRAFGSIANAPEAFQEALKVAQGQITAVNEAVSVMGDKIKIASEEFKAAGQVAADSTASIAAGAEKATASIEEIAAAAEKAKIPLPDIKRGFSDVANASKNMAESVGNAWKIDEEGGRLSARQIGLIVQNRLRLRESIDATKFATTEEAAVAEAAYGQWDGEVQRLILHTRNLHEAQEAATIGMKDAGGQMMMMGMLAEQVGKNFGEVGEKVGGAAGSLGMMAVMAEQAHKAFEGMKLNEFGGSASKTAIQIGLVAATFTAAAAAGLKFAETNEANKEIIDDVKRALYGEGGAIDSLTRSLGEAQTDWQTYAAHEMKAGERWPTMRAMLASMAGDYAGVADAVADLSKVEGNWLDEANDAIKAQDGRRKSMLELEAAFDKTIVTVREAIAAGHGMDEATKQQLQSATNLIVKLDAATRSSREHGSASKAEAGSIDAVSDAMKDVAKAMAAASILTGDHRTDIEKLIEVLRRELSANRDLSDARRKDAEAFIDLALKADAATKGFDRYLIKIKELLPESQKNSIELAELAVGLKKVLDNQSNLTTKQREQIQVIIDLASKGNELSASEKRLAEDLIKHALAHDKVTESAKAQYEAQEKLKSAVDQLTDAINESTAAQDQNQSAIHKAVLAGAALLASDKIQDSVERERLRRMIDLGKQIDELQIRQAKLATTTAHAAEASSDQAAATEKTYQVFRASAQTLQEDIERKKVLYEALRKLSAGQEELSSKTTQANAATAAIVKTVEDGHVVYTNVSKDAEALGISFGKAGEAEKKTAEQLAADKKFWDEFNDAMAKSGVLKFSEEITVTGDAIATSTGKMAAHAAATLRASDAWKDMDVNMTGTFRTMTDLEGHLDSVKEKADAAVKAVHALAISGSSGDGSDATPAGEG